MKAFQLCSFLFISTWILATAYDVNEEDSNDQENKKLFSDPTELTAGEILESHHILQQTSRLSPELEVLGFVTPWHEKGKQLSIKAADNGKIDFISPVTWQMHPSGLQGGEDFNETYFENIRVTGSKVYPRLLFENWNAEDFEQLTKQENVNKMISDITIMCKTRGFDGIVFEIWQALASSGALNEGNAIKMMKMVRQLGEGIRLDSIPTILVLPPFVRDVPQWGVTTEGISDLSMGFSHFIVMTYDYTTPGSHAGPLAPLDWVHTVGKYLAKDCQLGGKLLLGLNFYGIDFVQGENKETKTKDRHIVGDEVIRMIAEHQSQPLWIDKFGEHAFSYEKDDEHHVVFYPTRQSIRERVKIASELDCGGVAIWDIGQGLHHFFDAF